MTDIAERAEAEVERHQAERARWLVHSVGDKAEATHQAERAAEAEAERDRIRENLAGAREWRDRYAAAIVAVRGLADEWSEHDPDGHAIRAACAERLTAALDEHLGQP